MILSIKYSVMDPIRKLTPRSSNLLQKVEDLLHAFATFEGSESFHIFQHKHFWLLGLDHIHDVVHDFATIIDEAFL